MEQEHYEKSVSCSHDSHPSLHGALVGVLLVCSTSGHMYPSIMHLRASSSQTSCSLDLKL
jgi:hypothetical protein